MHGSPQKSGSRVRILRGEGEKAEGEDGGGDYTVPIIGRLGCEFMVCSSSEFVKVEDL